MEKIKEVFVKKGKIVDKDNNPLKIIKIAPSLVLSFEGGLIREPHLSEKFEKLLFEQLEKVKETDEDLKEMNVNAYLKGKCDRRFDYEDTYTYNFPVTLLEI